MENTPDRIALVMGLGRSGTTFLAKLIDTAPDVLYRHEPDAVLPTGLPSFCSPGQFALLLPQARDYVQAMADCRRFRSVGTLPVFNKSFRSRSANLVFKAMLLSAKAARRLKLPPPKTLPDLISAEPGMRLTLIKSVSALGRARLYSEAVPDLRSIHIIRHPCAVYASLHKGLKKGLMRAKPEIKPLFRTPEAVAYPFSLDEMKKASFEEQIAYRWMVTNDKAAKDMAGSPHYLRIGYEDLCTDVETVSRRIFEHLDLELGPQTQRFIDEVNSEPTNGGKAAGYFDVKRSITSGLDKWKTELDGETIERIREVVSHSPLGRTYFEEP
jgi:hypothetical protein